MLGYDDLKESIEVTRRKVQCPVKGCPNKVSRQRAQFKRAGRFRCPEHNIYISPSTFEYEYAIDNLLWHNAEDLRILNEIGRAGPGSGMARDNDEDAIAWNVFRYLERSNLTAAVMGRLAAAELEDPEVIYWSNHRGEGSSWSELEKARREFGESPREGTEPDLIIDSAGTLLFIEPKLLSDNITRPGSRKIKDKYLTGGQYWFSRVFDSEYHAVAVEDNRYELMRFWLLGTWMAARKGSDFRLISLVRDGKEEDLEEDFGKHISQSEARKFIRVTWEDIYRCILESREAGSEKEKILGYFKGKTVGYGRKGLLRKAFQV
jgi:hypothetical protein